MDASAMIATLRLLPHPEGGHFREIFRAAAPEGTRPSATSIFYLLAAGERSHWHRIDAEEVWAFHSGRPLELLISLDGTSVETHLLGPDIIRGQTPQVVVPRGAWQAARSTGAWTLVGCIVAPGFEFSGFELAPPEWSPGRAHDS